VQVMGRCVSCAGVPRSACLLFPSWLLLPISSVFAYIFKHAVAAPMHDACCWPHNCSCCSAMQQGRTKMKLHPPSPHSNTTTSGSVLLHDTSTTASQTYRSHRLIAWHLTESMPPVTPPGSSREPATPQSIFSWCTSSD
jgi:hypothetical protein